MTKVEGDRASSKIRTRTLPTVIGNLRHAVGGFLRKVQPKVGTVTEVFHDLKLGFKHSTWWMNTIAAICGFTTDVLRPLFHEGPLIVALVAATVSIVLLIATRTGRLPREAAAVFAVFFLMTAALSTTVFAAEEEFGEPSDGVAAQFFPAIKKLQASLNIINTKLDTLIRNIERLNTNIDRVTHQNPDASIIAHIGGEWGEGDCSAVRYSIVVNGSAIAINATERPVGAPAYRFVGTILKELDLSLEVRGESPAAAQGLEATFVYDGRSVPARLLWQDHTRGGSLIELKRCG